MKQKLKIAVVGSGVAGASSALFFSSKGHDVTVFEREKNPRPVGAGIMLQPPGIKILEELGLSQKVLALGTPIHQMEGFTRNGRKVIDLSLKQGPLCGLGLHRGALFSLLHEELKDKELPLILGAEIVGLEEKEGGKKTIRCKEGNIYEGFDLVIVANGASSKLREDLKITRISKRQTWGAIWTKVAHDNSELKNSIHQIYHKSKKMLGFMPIGKTSPDSEEYVNIFWSIRMDKSEEWQKAGLEKWKKEVLELAPEYKVLIDKITSMEQLTVAPYHDVTLSPSHSNRVVFIGDSAHAMSPQLSQGTSFALLDAKVLSEMVEAHQDIDKALAAYSVERKKQVGYYQTMSRLVTPLFQSDYKVDWFRDYVFKQLCGMRWTSKIVSSTILGYRESLFRNLNDEYYISS